jgi:hypothetical protein
MKLRYLMHRRSLLDLSDSAPEWDVFISAYNDSERVKSIFTKIRSTVKRWVVIPEYRYVPVEYASLQDPITFADDLISEADVIHGIADSIGIDNLRNARLCIDITGFMRPQILYMMRFLSNHGIKSFSMVYSEPAHYARRENTQFSDEAVSAVRQVIGFEGLHDDNMNHDCLIIGIGYDHALVSHVIDDRDSARQIKLLSLPSLSADMYQESILRLDRIDQALEHDAIFAPANDPFVVATELSEKFAEIQARGEFTNLYLSPLATKPQTLGFALFYLSELEGKPASIIFPFSRSYARETSKGIGRTWCYGIRI